MCIWPWLLVVGVSTCLATLWPSSAAAAGRTVTFRADDGRTVTGLIMEASQRPSPAVVLVPMLGKSKEDWQSVGQRLADANITALCIDLPATTVPGDAAGLPAWQADVRAAVNYLTGRPDIRPGAIGIGGASLGASLAVLAAATDPRVRSLVLVSPALDYRGVRIEAPMRQYGARPALLVASLKDPYAARTVRELSKESPGPREARWAQAPAHGTLLLAVEPDLVRVMIEWFQRTLA